MREHDYLDINFNDLPEIFHHIIDNVNYRFRLYYNGYDDSFHIDIWDQYNVPIVMGEKLVYGEPLWNSINDPRLPMVQLTPIDDSGKESKVSALNFPSVVKLEFLDSIPDSDDIDDSSVTDDSDDDTSIDPSQIDDNEYGNDPVKRGGNS